MSPRARFLSMLLVAAAAAAYALRPVRRPVQAGNWQPAEPHSARR